MYKGLYIKAKKVIKRDADMKFYNAPRPLYWENDAWGVSLEAGVVQVREGMNFECDKVTGNATLHPIPFTRKSL